MLQPFESCAECHDVGLAPPPWRSWWPTVAVASLPELVQLLHDLPDEVPSRFDPVRMSCWFGLSPRPFTTAPFSVSELSFDSLLLPLCKSATLAATCTPLALHHGPAPTRSAACILPGLSEAPHAPST